MGPPLLLYQQSKLSGYSRISPVEESQTLKVKLSPTFIPSSISGVVVSSP
jgi:hypothetical protein